MKICGVPDCSRKSDARGLCNRHYQSWRKKGRQAEHLGFQIPGPRPTRYCSLDGCDEVHYAREFCHRHYWHFKEYGDPGRVERPVMDDANLPNPWINVAPSCPRCGERALLWASDSALAWFCPPCRKRFDIAKEAAA